MKNIIVKYLFFILWFLYLCSNTQAFFGEDVWLDLYKNLDTNFSSNLWDWFQTELSWTHGSIKDKLNSLIDLEAQLQGFPYTNCIKSDIAPSQLEAIHNGNTSILYSKINDTCKNSSWNIDVSTVTFIQKVLQKHYQSSFQRAQEKIEIIWDISSLGIYSDGNLDNSSFDIIDDLEKINDIIFASKFTYNWSESQNYQDIFDKINDDKKREVLQNTTDKSVINEINDWEKAYNKDSWWFFLENLLQSQQHNSNICVDPNSWDHWLDIRFLNEFELGEDSSNLELVEDLENAQNPEIFSWSQNNNTAVDLSGNYQKVNDNAMWPCDSFYCITVDFKTYNHQLLGWWDNITIEYIIDRSNQHLSKFANASLIPAKMTTNNFELWLSNLNLWDLFHMSFQIQTKPVPILSLQKGEKNPQEDKYSSNTLLEKYYKAYWLDYKRRNDLDNFTKNKEELASIIQSTDSQITQAQQRVEKLETYLAQKDDEVEILKKDISEKFSQENLWEFHNQLIEINNFTKSITEYANTLWELIQAMDKIKTNG